MTGSSARPAAQAAAALGAFVAIAVVAGIVAAGLLMPAVGAAGAAARESVDFFDELPAELESGPLAQPSTIVAADGTVLGRFFSENRIVKPLAEMSPFVQDAIVAVEDNRFFEHNGVDPEGLARAFVNNSTGGDTQGASTLTQQYVKNVQIERAVAANDDEALNDANAQTYERKLREAKLAIATEKELSKEQILEGYLNISLFGEGVYGVEAAAQHFFSVSALDLTLPQAALLAGATQSPSYYDPEKNPEASVKRRDIVLGRMLSTGKITQAEHDEAVATPLVLTMQEVPTGCSVAGSAAYMCDYVQRLIRSDEQYGATPEERENLLLRGGLTITTTLQMPRQNAAAEAVENAVPADDPDQIGNALVSVEPGTGHIVAMAQNREFSAESGDGKTSVNYNVDSQYGQSSGFQPGSNFKPFVLAAWLEAGHSIYERVGSGPRTYTWQQVDTGDCGSIRGAPSWTPRNSEGSGGGSITALEATYRSVNTAYAHMMAELELCDIKDVAERLGVHKAAPDASGSTELGLNMSMILGADSVSPLTMAAAYATFANEGEYCAPMAITKVVNSAGETVAEPQPACEQVLDVKIANTIANAMTQTLENGRGTGRSLQIGRQAAGKTGTTNGSYDTWFTGYTPQLSTSSWVGDTATKRRSLSEVVINGRGPRNVYGATVAGPAWQEYMEAALEGEPEERFPASAEFDRRSTGGGDDRADRSARGDQPVSPDGAVTAPEAAAAPQDAAPQGQLVPNEPADQVAVDQTAAAEPRTQNVPSAPRNEPADRQRPGRGNGDQPGRGNPAPGVPDNR